MTILKLNCDLAEGVGCEAEVLPFIDQANIACGAHAGSAALMQSTAELAKEHGVSIGAHPGYPDRDHYGRVTMAASTEQIREWVAAQVEQLAALAKVDYVKPHGALYHDMCQRPEVLAAIREAISDRPLMGPAQEAFDWPEAFADRRYLDDGTLVPRGECGAVLAAVEVLAQARQLAETGTVTTNTGKHLALSAQTLCVHGDNPSGVSVIRAIREMLSHE